MDVLSAPMPGLGVARCCCVFMAMRERPFSRVASSYEALRDPNAMFGIGIWEGGILQDVSMATFQKRISQRWHLFLKYSFPESRSSSRSVCPRLFRISLRRDEPRLSPAVALNKEPN